VHNTDVSNRYAAIQHKGLAVAYVVLTAIAVLHGISQVFIQQGYLEMDNVIGFAKPVLLEAKGGAARRASFCPVATRHHGYPVPGVESGTESCVTWDHHEMVDQVTRLANQEIFVPTRLLDRLQVRMRDLGASLNHPCSTHMEMDHYLVNPAVRS
jgi:hypothetical protein